MSRLYPLGFYLFLQGAYSNTLDWQKYPWEFFVFEVCNGLPYLPEELQSFEEFRHMVKLTDNVPVF